MVRTAVVVVFALALACSGGGAEPTQPAPGKKLADGKVGKPTANQLCQARCEREAACQVPEHGCMRECLGWQRTTEHVRGDLLWRLLTCLDSIECPFVEQGDAWQQCFDSTRALVPLTPALRRFCFESARRAAVCGRRSEADQSGCRDQFRHLEDAALERAIACLKRPCAEVPVCFQRSFRM
jgi:hypothetical protein